MLIYANLCKYLVESCRWLWNWVEFGLDLTFNVSLKTCNGHNRFDRLIMSIYANLCRFMQICGSNFSPKLNRFRFGLKLELIENSKLKRLMAIYANECQIMQIGSRFTVRSTTQTFIHCNRSHFNRQFVTNSNRWCPLLSIYVHLCKFMPIYANVGRYWPLPMTTHANEVGLGRHLRHPMTNWLPAPSHTLHHPLPPLPHPHTPGTYANVCKWGRLPVSIMT